MRGISFKAHGLAAAVLIGSVGAAITQDAQNVQNRPQALDQQSQDQTSGPAPFQGTKPSGGSFLGAGPVLGLGALQGVSPLEGMGPLQGDGPWLGAGPLLGVGPLMGAGPLQGSAPLLAGGALAATPPVFVVPRNPSGAPPMILLASLPASLLTTLVLAPAPPSPSIPTSVDSGLPLSGLGMPRIPGDSSPTSTPAQATVPLASPGTSYVPPATPAPVVSPQNICTTASCT